MSLSVLTFISGMKPVAYLDYCDLSSPGPCTHLFQQLLPVSELDRENKIATLARFASPKDFSFVQKKIWPDFYSIENTIFRLRVVERMTGTKHTHWMLETVSMMMVLGNWVTDSTDHSPNASEFYWELYNIFSNIAFMFGTFSAKSWCSGDSRTAWVEPLQRTMQAIMNLFEFPIHLTTGPQDSQSVSNYTQLERLIAGYDIISRQEWILKGRAAFSPTAFMNAILPWLRLLRDCGVDLEEYGQNQTFDIKRCRSHNEKYPVYLYLHMVGFCYGPNPENWHFWLAEPTDELAGEFWRLIDSYSEPSVLRIPGGWIE